MAERALTLRAVLDDRGTVLIGVCLVGVLVGGWLSYTAYTTDVTTEQRTETVWETTGEFSHGAVVESNSSVFAEGAQLRGRPIYFIRVSPRLTGGFESSYAGTPRGNLSRQLSVSLLIRAVERQDGDSEPEIYWQRMMPLNETTVDGVEPQEPVSVSFSYNMSALNGQIDRINDRLGTEIGERKVLIRATVDSRGTVRGRQVTETNNYTIPVAVTETTYSVGPAEPTTEQYERSRTETVESTAGPLRSVGGPAMVGLSLGGLVALVVARRLDWIGLSDAERDRLTYRQHREEFDDWISAVELPPEAFDLPRAEAESLTALVDVAIDTNNSVIEAPNEEVFYVRHDGYLYSYRPPTHGPDTADQTDIEEESERVDNESTVDSDRDSAGDESRGPEA